MSQKQYHGDPSRDHNFWVYPRHKSLKNPRWDIYNASDLCDNYILLDKKHFTGVERYKCNGHENIWTGEPGHQDPKNYQTAALPIKIFHGDPSRDYNFWVYPTHKSLINSHWDTYNASDLCDNHTLLEENHFTGVQRYQCNGHENICHDGPGYQHPNTYGNAALPVKVFHGDPSRDHKFWVYPRHKSLINPSWDTYNADDLCDNYTSLEKNLYTEIESCKCNGHENIWLGNP